MKQVFTFKSPSDYSQIHYSVFEHPKPKACVLILHGLAEHRGRYDDIAQVIASLGFVVLTIDQRGHGESGAATTFGYFGDEEGWQCNIQDIRAITLHVTRQYKLQSTLVIGHSMGTIVALSLLKHYGEDFSGCVLSAVPVIPKGLFFLKTLMSGLEWIFGAKTPSALFFKLTFEKFDQHHQSLTKNGWLSVDEANVQRYNADPWCGFTLTHRGVLDLLDGFKDVMRLRAKDNTFAGKPMWLVVGLKDPSANHPEDINMIMKRLHKQGYTSMSLTLDPFSQHEVFFDVNATTLKHELYQFIQRTMQGEVR